MKRKGVEKIGMRWIEAGEGDGERDEEGTKQTRM